MYLTGPVTVNKNEVKCFNYIFEEFKNFLLVHGSKHYHLDHATEKHVKYIYSYFWTLQLCFITSLIRIQPHDFTINLLKQYVQMLLSYYRIQQK